VIVVLSTAEYTLSAESIAKSSHDREPYVPGDPECGTPFPFPGLDSLVAQAIGLVRAVKHQGSSRDAGSVLDSKRIARHTQMLYDVNDNDSRAVEAALYSAVYELPRPPQGPTGPGPEDADRVLALELIRVAYNRAQRALRQETRLQQEAARGEAGPGCSDFRPIDNISANSEIFSAQIRELLDGVYGELEERERRVVEALSQGIEWDEVVRREGVHRTTVSRVVKRISDRMTKFLAPD
jgi:hypothetical protein